VSHRVRRWQEVTAGQWEQLWESQNIWPAGWSEPEASGVEVVPLLAHGTAVIRVAGDWAEHLPRVTVESSKQTCERHAVNVI
jgi:hypothetical protein